MIDKQELRRICEAAKPCWGMYTTDAQHEFSELMTPVFILQLLDEIEACKADAERFRRLRDGGYLPEWAAVHVCDEHMRAELEALAVDRVLGMYGMYGKDGKDG